MSLLWIMLKCIKNNTADSITVTMLANVFDKLQYHHHCNDNKNSITAK